MWIIWGLLAGVVVGIFSGLAGRGRRRGVGTVAPLWLQDKSKDRPATSLEIPAGTPVFRVLWRLRILGLTATFYLIGSNVSRATLKQVGVRPLIQGVLLWLVVAVVSMAAIRAGWIGL